MGMLSRFNLKEFTQKYNIQHLIETGAYYGDSIYYAKTQGYSVESCEINNKFHFLVKDRFQQYSDIKIEFLPSYKFLQVASEKLPSLYWLDAHLPELYHHHEEGVRYAPELSTPLQTELELVIKKENFNYSIIIIDDVRMYHPQIPCENSVGNKPVVPEFKLLEWCEINTNETHDMFFSPSDEGYLILLPKTKYTEFIPDQEFIPTPVYTSTINIAKQTEVNRL